MLDRKTVSKILLKGLVSGIVNGIAIYIAYRLGQRESDRKWASEAGNGYDTEEARIRLTHQLNKLEEIYRLHHLQPIWGEFSPDPSNYREFLLALDAIKRTRTLFEKSSPTVVKAITTMHLDMAKKFSAELDDIDPKNKFENIDLALRVISDKIADLKKQLANLG